MDIGASDLGQGYNHFEKAQNKSFKRINRPSLFGSFSKISFKDNRFTNQQLVSQVCVESSTDKNKDNNALKAVDDVLNANNKDLQRNKNMVNENLIKAAEDETSLVSRLNNEACLESFAEILENQEDLIVPSNDEINQEKGDNQANSYTKHATSKQTKEKDQSKKQYLQSLSSSQSSLQKKKLPKKILRKMSSLPENHESQNQSATNMNQSNQTKQ